MNPAQTLYPVLQHQHNPARGRVPKVALLPGCRRCPIAQDSRQQPLEEAMGSTKTTKKMTKLSSLSSIRHSPPAKEPEKPAKRRHWPLQCPRIRYPAATAQHCRCAWGFASHQQALPPQRTRYHAPIPRSQLPQAGRCTASQNIAAPSRWHAENEPDINQAHRQTVAKHRLAICIRAGNTRSNSELQATPSAQRTRNVVAARQHCETKEKVAS